MKIDNPDMEKIRKAANTDKKQQNSMKTTPGISCAFQLKTNNMNKTITCYACGENGHKSIECKKNKDSLKYTKCKRTGHLAKIYRSKTDNGSTTTPKRNDKARVATTAQAEEDEDDTAIHEACLLYTSPSPRD